jgi:Xaa-Pro aminopeptidase
MIFTDVERRRRWTATRMFAEASGLEAVVARATPAPDGQGGYRWLSLYAPLSADGAVVLSSDDAALFVHDGPQAMYAAATSWFDNPAVAPGVINGLSRWLVDRGIARLGVVDLPSIPHRWVTRLLDDISGLQLVDVSPELLRLRTAKSREERAIIERCARIADEAWRGVLDYVVAGRPEHEVLADADHYLRARGCDGNFNLIMHTSGRVAFDRQPSDRLLVAGDSFLLELSPRLHGYYTQLTNLVSIGPPDDELSEAFDAANAARAHAAQVIRPGVRAGDVSRAITEFLDARGVTSSGPSFGHFVGLELEEPRISDPDYVLREDSVFVFHPVVKTARHAPVLRGDTYWIGTDGPTVLSTLPETITVVPGQDVGP